MINTPTIITLLRFALTIIMIIFYFIDTVHSFILPLFVLAALSDWLDGYLARKMKLQTSFGAFLDQFADKFLVASSLIILAVSYQTVWITLPTLLIINRDLLMASFRHFASEQQLSHLVEVNRLGKMKTAIQLIAIGLLLSYPGLVSYHFFYYLGVFGLNISACLGWIGFVTYCLLLSKKLGTLHKNHT
jgi:CDP-diacylglycerol--glycerol-3-phosphate 3-phosphatidyltransferase